MRSSRERPIRQHVARALRVVTVALVAAALLAGTGAARVDALTRAGHGDGGRSVAGVRDLDRLATRGPEPTLPARAAAGTTVRRLTVQWQGGGAAPRSKSMRIPGIGRLTLTCRPDVTRVSLQADQRDRETQLWMAKYEDKSYGPAVAVKTVRIFRYAHAFDDGRGGTANPQHEGLNQRGGVHGVENYAKGYAHGVISQRGSRNDLVGDAPLEPVTTFDLNWYWNGFDYPPRYRSCKVDGVFVTTGARMGVNWHGEADARNSTQRVVRIPDVGYVELRCEPERYGRKTVSFIPDDPGTKAYVETVEGEGRVDQHVETRNRVTDRETGRLGPIELPNNGIMRIYVDTGRRKVPFILSSFYKTNDPRPRLNSCEVAMGRFPR